eukprot:maker-scaffold121_size336169-snap-gene-2.37 protein:Tk01643 transcript:maker-scaffold121_size336169-snap-gene-2.37-mRNA-1 annotation:"hypothetical protein L798_15617"
MGGYLGKAMDDNLQKNQQFMLDMNRLTMERQIQMQNQMRERMAAIQVARAREMFVWLGSFYGLATVAMIRGFQTTKRPGVLAPLLPLTFLLGYQADLAYGTKLNRIKSEAENILMFERDLIEMPTGLPSISSLDVARLQMEEEAKYKATTPSTTQ